MLARLQQRIVLALALATTAWVTLFSAAGHPLVAWLGALLLLFGHAAVLGIEFLLMSRLNRGDDAPRARTTQVLRAWLAESLIAPQVFCWRQPFRSRAVPDAVDAPGRRGVVFVHGFVCNRGLWNPWLRRLRARGVPFVAVNLEPVFGSIDDYVPLIERAVQAIAAGTGLPPLIVAHSMGGLAVRAWLAEAQADERVQHVITIGTPHRGTFLGAMAYSANTRQMHLGSEWLARLAAREPAQRASRFTCFFGHCDNIVFPASTATLPGADNRHIAACAHVQMALRDEVFGEVERWLARPAAHAGANSRSPGSTAPASMGGSSRTAR